MKTAEETLKENFNKQQPQADARFLEFLWEDFKMEDNYTAAIDAMKAYALAVVEEDRKDAAFQLTGNLFADGIMIPDSKVVPHIMGRKLPDLK